MVLSVELAYLLAKSGHEDEDRFTFAYLGRKPMKGVIDDVPYPVVAVAAERNADKRKLRVKERGLLHQESVSSLAVQEFLSVFMSLGGIEAPVLANSRSATVELQFPASYLDFRERWNSEAKDTDNSISLQVKSETAVDEVDEGGLEDSTAFLDQITSDPEDLNRPMTSTGD